ncbi:unnamed protein product [Brachionus calyciflorus]|uniref:tRNA:m(4)X modification enzyme TRM13 n=1 Tax=Brachionus calyciflorus TaxID=104777 RepID=A0A813M702_9BILA|nr:unnamed protein product [Brachionus calyciflorus]
MSEVLLEVDQVLDENETNLRRICKHICEKKKRQCKFSALKNCDYCVEHLAFNKETDHVGKRVICPLDPKHSVYEKNLEKHLKKCNSRIKYLGDFDIKDVNLKDDENLDFERNLDYKLNIDLNNKPLLKNISQDSKTYKQLNENELRAIIEFVNELDEKFNLYELEFDKLDDKFINEELTKKGEFHQKHLKQISSIVSHVNVLIDSNKGEEEESCCLVELGAGRGKLSCWFDQSRRNKIKNNNSNSNIKNCNIVLLERGCQKHKFDSLLKQNCQEDNSEFARIRIDLKDVFINKIPLVKKSSKYILYGKHVCGCATDFSIRCLKKSLEDQNENKIKFLGFILALCCHHVCEWDYFCEVCLVGRQVDVKKIQHLPLNLFLDIKDPKLEEYNYSLNTKLFYYVESEVTLENSMIYATLQYNE